jgi:hypothetical protein
MTADDDRPPVLGTWRNVYALVLGVLAAVTALLAALAHTYR